MNNVVLQQMLFMVQALFMVQRCSWSRCVHGADVVNGATRCSWTGVVHEQRLQALFMDRRLEQALFMEQMLFMNRRCS